MLIRDVMVRNPITVKQEMSVVDAKRVLQANKISSVPVMNKNDELVGIITRNDLLKIFPSEATTLDVYEIAGLLNKISVKDVMTKSVKTVSEDFTVEEAARLMADYDIGCLPVLNGNLLVGIVTVSKLFRAFINMFSTSTPGVRAIISMEDNRGTLANIASKIAAAGGNIISVVTYDSVIANQKKVTIKSTVSVEDFKRIASECNAEICDIRNV
ncbi:MAG: CBS domain-containing protein [Treponema sp.]|nr:CBS domain-containing protein [Treponema sp.]